MCFYNFRVEYLDSQLEGLSLEKMFSLSASISCCLSRVGPHEFPVSLLASLLVPLLFKQLNCWGMVNEASLSFLEDTLLQTSWFAGSCSLFSSPVRQCSLSSGVVIDVFSGDNVLPP